MTQLTHGGDWAGYRAQYGHDALDFSANVSPLGLPQGVANAIAAALPHADRYPDPLCRALRAKLAPHEGIPAESILCGNGALFQSPNNSILIASAPPERSGSASGMLATARLIGQTTGAALMALLFHIVPENSTHAALLLAGGFAVVGAAVSLARISLPLPEGLTRHK